MADKQTQAGSKHVVEKVEPRAGGVGGRIEMSPDVVATIASQAVQNIRGIHKLGASRLVPFGGSNRGVAAEVGDREAAVDLEVVIEYGCDIRDIADEIRSKVADGVNQMADRKVVEVNIDVVDVHVPEPEREEKSEETPRVR